MEIAALNTAKRVLEYSSDTCRRVARTHAAGHEAPTCRKLNFLSVYRLRQGPYHEGVPGQAFMTAYPFLKVRLHLQVKHSFPRLRTSLDESVT